MLYDDTGLIAANLPGFDMPVRRPFFETLVQLIIGPLLTSVSATVTPISLVPVRAGRRGTYRVGPPPDTSRPAMSAARGSMYSPPPPRIRRAARRCSSYGGTGARVLLGPAPEPD
ncbi:MULTISPECIES: hypothetical protein [unclassified Streptomyces]|uniref:hypothetical protein n=1 Tax=unclassified Streptomyces TaxID=2593676 RepID=UPI0023670342|nr:MULTISPECIES: hypothetical protein [unclassified Streptomyces]MDF3147859.1 hypothetical protein [Streptomyces sp. T21Q-yed]WDF45003.1 hypothetical protein PBV52_42115 [Streptomyces sp. T12]